MSTLRERLEGLEVKWRGVTVGESNHGSLRPLTATEANVAHICADELAAALAAEGQDVHRSPDLRTRLEKLHKWVFDDTFEGRERHVELVELSKVLDLLAAAPSLHLTPAKVREAIEATWNAGFPFVPGITDEQIQFVTGHLNDAIKRPQKA